MPIRVLHFLHSLRRAGSQTLLLRVYRKIDRKNIQFDFAIREFAKDDYRKEIRKLGGNVFKIPKLNVVNMPVIERKILDIFVDKGPFSAVHAHSDYHSGYILHAAHRYGIQQRIAHSHSTGKYGSKFSIYVLFSWLMRRCIQRYASELVAVSRPAAEWLYGKGCLNDDRLMILHNAIDLAPYSKLSDNKRKYRSLCSLPQDKILIGHIGRFTKEKNHILSIKIFKIISKIMPEARLILVGDGDLQPEVRMWVSNNDIQDKVHFLGVRTDIPEILKSLDLFLFPSLYEGLGIVLVEAQAAGVPCVTSSVIPSEADVGLNLVDDVSLDAEIKEWIYMIRKGLKKKCPSWKVRYQALKDAGYDIEDVVMKWEELYLGSG